MYQIATATLIRRPYLLPSVVYIVDIAYAPAMCHYQMLVPDGMIQKGFIGTPVLEKGRTTPMNMISLAMSFTISHQSLNCEWMLF